MTASIATAVQRRGRPRRGRPLTPYGDLAELCEEIARTANTLSWPSARYRKDPVAFFREILGVEPWSKQVEIIEAIRDHKRVSVRSGHKVSKSHTIAGIALWFFCSFPDARVVLSSTTARQVDQILWREIRMMHARAGKCAACKAQDTENRPDAKCEHSAEIGGDMHELARSGLKSIDFREIVGFTAKEAEAVAGISGKNLLYLLDEASGIPQPIFEAIEGNRAGGARLAMFSNPTRTEGEHFDSFHDEKKKKLYRTITISSEETPNVIEGREVIPGLATREWIDEKREEWGEDSPLYKIRVKGLHVLGESGKIISVHAITEAEARWEETPAEGRLHIGVDPAGDGGDGDESGFSIRRGKKAIAIHAMLGLSEDAHVVHVLGFISTHRLPREQLPVVTVDREGPVGAKVYYALRAHLEKPGHEDDFVLVGVRSSEAATREPGRYHLVRDELWAVAAEWFKEGGAIPTDAKLAKELHAPSWTHRLSGEAKATPKKELRKILGRSPDRADALTLSLWEPMAILPDNGAEQSRKATSAQVQQHADDHADDGIDPYAPAIDPYAPAIDPYGGSFDGFDEVDTYSRRRR